MESQGKPEGRRTWLHRKTRRRSAEFWGTLHPGQILEEHRTASGNLIGPYETTYDLSTGYGLDREILQP